MTTMTARELRAQKAKKKPAREEQAERARALGEEDLKARQAPVEEAVAEQPVVEPEPSVGAQAISSFGDFLARVKAHGLRAALEQDGIDPDELGVDFASGPDRTVVFAPDESHLAEQDKFNTPAAKEARRHAERLARIARGEEQP